MYEGYGVSGDIFDEDTNKRYNKVFIGNKKVLQLFSRFEEDDDDDDSIGNMTDSFTAAENSLIQSLTYVHSLTNEKRKEVERFEREQEGATLLYLIIDGRMEMVISMSDEVRDCSKTFITDCHKLALKTILCTGDSEYVALKVGKRLLGIQEIHASMTPKDKLN